MNLEQRTENFDQHVKSLKQEYAEERTVEHLVVPLSENAWQLLATLKQDFGMSVSETIERALSISFWADSTEWM